MSSNESENERYEMLVNGDIHKVIPWLAVPTIISMMVSAIYNMADTFFVSQLGTSASGAVGIIFSAMAIIQALSLYHRHGQRQLHGPVSGRRTP